MCKKKYYPTRKLAKAFIKKHLAKGLSKQSSYKCDKCDGFHLTTKIGANYKSVVRRSVREGLSYE